MCESVCGLDKIRENMHAGQGQKRGWGFLVGSERSVQTVKLQAVSLSYSNGPEGVETLQMGRQVRKRKRRDELNE